MFKMAEKLKELIEQAQEVTQDESITDIELAIHALGPHYGSQHPTRRVYFAWDSTGTAPSGEEPPLSMVVLYTPPKNAGIYGDDCGVFTHQYREGQTGDIVLDVAKDSSLIILLNGCVPKAYITHRYSPMMPAQPLASPFDVEGMNNGTSDAFISYPIVENTQHIITIHNKPREEGT